MEIKYQTVYDIIDHTDHDGVQWCELAISAQYFDPYDSTYKRAGASIFMNWISPILGEKIRLIDPEARVFQYADHLLIHRKNRQEALLLRMQL